MSAGEDISARVAEVLVEARRMWRKTKSGRWPPSRGTLGAESIDLLDIVFRLEREFGIKIPRGELFPDSIFWGDPDLVSDGRVTDRGMAELHCACPGRTCPASSTTPGSAWSLTCSPSAC